MDHSFDYNGARLTVRRATVRDRLAFQKYFTALIPFTDDDGIYESAAFYQVSQIFSMTAGDIGMDIPSPGATGEEILQAFDGFLALDAELFERLVKEINAINGPLADAVEAVNPPADPKD